MSSLAWMALVSFLACVGFTFYTSKFDDSTKGQSLKDSMMEAWTNVVIGFTINYVANYFILPSIPSLGHNQIDPIDNFLMGWMYTVISMARSFFIRRWHNHKHLVKTGVVTAKA